MSAPDRIATALAALTAGLRIEEVPEAVSLRARHLILDAIGCALASRREDYAARFLAATCALNDGGGPGSEPAASAASGARGLIGYAERVPLRDAAMMNGVLAHGLDYDDTHMAGVIHLTVSVLPAVLAVGAARRVSGSAMLTAYIAGVEAGARIASVVKSGLHAHGFHPTGVVGAFASALAAGRLMGLDAEALVRAQGIALSLASGSLQFIEDGSWTKRLHPGWAAQAGITAATMAAHGIAAPHAPYEGRYGFYRLYLGQTEHALIDPALALAGLAEGDGGVNGGADRAGISGAHRAGISGADRAGTSGADRAGTSGAGDAVPKVTQWEINNVAIKPFPMCHFVHASIDAAVALHRQGVQPDAVRAIEVLVPAGVVAAVCEPAAAKRRPQSDYDAKFSLPYAVASGLLRGKLGLAELVPAAYRDPAACALMDRVTYTEDAASTFPQHYTGEVRVTLADGRVLRHRESINRGHAERPLTNAGVVEKFSSNATLHFSQAHAGAVRAQVLDLDHLADVRVLEDLLARAPSLVD